MIQLHYDSLVLAKRSLGKAIFSIFRCPNHHVAFTSRKESLAIRSRIFRHDTAIFCIVVYLEIHPCSIYRFSCLIHDREFDASRRAIVIYQVDFRIVRGTEHHFLRTIVIAESLGVHQHSTRGRRIKPSKIEHRLWLASSQEIPFAISPSFHPSMVVVGMRPTRGINLSSRYAYRPQGSHRESTLLATSSISRANGGERSRSAGIRRLISHSLMAPVVHLQDGILHAHALHPLLQLSIEHLSGVIEILIVHTYRQHEMAEEQLRHFIAPTHLLSCLKSGAYILQEKRCRIVGYVSYWHVGIEEAQCLLLVFISLSILKVFHVKKLLTHQCHLLSEGFLHLRAIVGIRDEMCLISHRHLERGEKQES